MLRIGILLLLSMVGGGCAARLCYLQAPQELAVKGYFTFDVAVAQLDQESGVHIVSANGGDWTFQPLSIQLIDEAAYAPGFQNSPYWYSADFLYEFAVSIDDITGDGIPDLLSAAFAGPANLDYSLGGVYVHEGYRAAGKTSFKPSRERLTAPIGATDLSVADIDADGDADLLVAAHYDSQGALTAPVIYLNRNGRFRAKADWQAADSVGAGALTVADFDGDGFLDVAFRGKTLDVYFGSRVLPDQVPFASHADIRVEDEPAPNSNFWQIQSAPLGSTARAAVLTATTTGYFAYEFARTGYRTLWTEPSRFAFGIAAFDLDGDRLSEVITSPWGEELAGGRVCGMSLPGDPSICLGGPLQVRTGAPDGVDERGPCLAGAARTIAQKVRPLVRAESPTRVLTLRETIAHPFSVVTFPEATVVDIERITLDGVPLADSGHTYRFNIENNWLSLSPVVESATIEIVYRMSPNPGAVVATGAPQQGIWVLSNNLVNQTKETSR